MKRKQGYDYFEGLGRIYYDYELTENKNALNYKRKYYILKRFALASMQAKYGYKRSKDSKYKKDFSKRIDTTDCIIHHEIDERIYLIPKAIHSKIAHYGYVSLLG